MFVFALKEAEDALKYYKGYKGESLKENQAFFTEFQRIKIVIEQQSLEKKWSLEDLCECFATLHWIDFLIALSGTLKTN